MLRRCCQSFGSIVLIVTSILIGWIIQTGRKTTSVDLTTAQPLQLRALTSLERDEYRRDGTVLVKQLLDVSQTERLKASIDDTPVLKGSIFDLISSSLFDQIRFDLWRSDATIASLALQSLPAIAGSVFATSHLRLLRDAYFSYASGSRGCGWHVDDEGFWPTLNDTSGVTIWIALDDMTDGGGLMVANRTAFTDDQLLPHCRQKTRSATCDMERLAPECQDALEKAAIRTWNVQAGDAILWDRWVFHRTIPLEAGEAKLQRRYSVRYIPDTAKAFGAIHTSIPQEGSFIGSPYYPQVLPTLIDTEMEALRNGLEADFSLSNLFLNLARILYKYVSDQTTKS